MLLRIERDCAARRFTRQDGAREGPRRDRIEEPGVQTTGMIGSATGFNPERVRRQSDRESKTPRLSVTESQELHDRAWLHAKSLPGNPVPVTEIRPLVGRFPPFAGIAFRPTAGTY